jgi:hypothetical protein
MTQPQEQPPIFPHYQPPTGLHVATRQESAPLQKAISRMFKPKLKVPIRRKGKGLKSKQDVHITESRPRYW